MKIALIAHNLKRGGGNIAGRKIIETLPQVAPQHEFFMVCPQNAGFPSFGKQDDIHTLLMPPLALWKRWMWEKRILTPALQAFNPDWVWCLGNIGLSSPPCKQSVWIRDAHHVNYGRKYFQYGLRNMESRLKIALINQRIKRSVKETNRFYCQTETMRRRFAQKYAVPLDKIGLCPLSVSIPPAVKTNKHTSLDEHNDSFRFLYVSGCMPHKNMHRIVEAFHKKPEQLSNIKCFFTIDPAKNKVAKKLHRQIIKRGLEDQIFCIGTIPYHEIGYYYQSAEAVIFPTTLETVGAAHLEAMYFERPLLASNLDFAHEICGDAALFVDPFSPTEIAEGMVRLRDNQELRDSLVAKGQRQITKNLLSWPEILRNVLDQEGVEHE